MIFIVFTETHVWAAYEDEAEANAAAADMGGYVQPVHFVRGRK